MTLGTTETLIFFKNIFLLDNKKKHTHNYNILLKKYKKSCIKGLIYFIQRILFSNFLE